MIKRGDSLLLAVLLFLTLILQLMSSPLLGRDPPFKTVEPV
ncbi:MAG: hypothetical protein O7D93_06105 [Acidobacteria bacterium]|nr:hypothetical protein [Acidobacteriota bacterium]